MSILQEVGRFLLREEGRIRGSAPTGGGDAPTVNVDRLLERMAQLELALEDQEYRRLTWRAEQEFSREGLRDICELARVMWLKNPLISRGVGVSTDYVFGQGVNIHARDKLVDTVVQAFLDDPRNQAELTSQQAMMIKEQELEVLANLFFVFFVQPVTGRVRVRTIPFDEIEEVICNPEDAKEPWFYRRRWTSTKLDLQTGKPSTETVIAYYPDWRYRPTGGTRQKPKTILGHPVKWESPLYHVKVNCLSDMQFGVSEVYAAIDWARAYKEFLEDWSTIVRAYSRFAWQLTVKGGKGAVQAARAKLNTTLGPGGETNPPPVTGSMFVGQEGYRLDPVRTAGATTSAEDGRRLLLMVAAALGLPESFFGDVSVGSLATAKSLDRPTELRFKRRQTLWVDIFKAILSFVIEMSVRAPRGLLSGTVRIDDATVVLTLEINPETGEPRDNSVDVDFPPILEHDPDSRINSIVKAATLGGGQLAGTMTLRMAARMLLTALGEDDVDQLLDELFPEGSGPSTNQMLDERVAAGTRGQGTDDEGLEDALTVEAEMREAVRELRGAIVRFVEEYAGVGAG